MHIKTNLIVVLTVVASLTPVTTGLAQQTPLPSTDDVRPLARTQVILGLALPDYVAGTAPVLRPLEVLSREPCDQKAIEELGTALAKVGYRRDAARAHVGFSASCGGHAPSLRSAANIYLGLSDHVQAAEVATRLIKLEPFGDNGYFLRALANDRGRKPAKAIDDYLTAIELFPDKSKISSASYVGLAQAYERLGQACDAAAAIDAWVAIDPARNDTSQSRAIQSGYRSKGGCPAAVAAKTETFPLKSGHAIVPATINGIKGSFLVDTGATVVSLRASFADKAKVAIDKDSGVLLHTANGMARGSRGRAQSIQLRSLSTSDVAVVVHADESASYGPGIDGLLGMSFLSRFQLAMDGRSLKISARSGSATVSPDPPQGRSAISAPQASPSKGSTSGGTPAASPRGAPSSTTGSIQPQSGGSASTKPTPPAAKPTPAQKPKPDAVDNVLTPGQGLD